MERTANFNGMILYQIYPRSFKDSNGDGVGDLNGVTSKLDYLKDTLGINTVWLSPFYKSPMADFGYDVSDYCAVDPIFGTLDDFKRLLQQAHQRNLRVMIDFVLNHTSIEHPWFKESRQDKTNPKRDWYIWRDAKPDGSPPNNWRSSFGGSAWTFDEATRQYYLHSFLAQQPDLNWDNPAVRAAMKAVLKFWLDLGVDGFRLDSPAAISKDPDLRDNPPNPKYKPGTNDQFSEPLLLEYNENGPHLFEYLEELAEFIKENHGRHMVLEAYPDDAKSPTRYYDKFYHAVDPVVSAPFNFEMIDKPWQATAYQKTIDSFEHDMHPDYSTVYGFGNHDRSRIATRLGRPAARTLAMLALTLPGVPIIYNGDELAMVNGKISKAQLRDPFAINTPGFPGRDPERTPLAWNNGKNGGFTTGQPWLPLNQDFATCNVASQLKDENSSLNLYRELLKLRHKSKALAIGTYKSIDTHNCDVYGYERKFENETLTVLLNFSDKPQPVENVSSDKIVLSTQQAKHTGKLTLKPHEGVIIKN